MKSMNTVTDPCGLLPLYTLYPLYSLACICYTKCNPRALSPGRGLLIPLGYLHPGKCEHSEVQSHPPLCDGRSTLDGFRRYAHARVITDFKNMTDYHEERTLEGLREVENEDKNDCHKTTRDS